VTFRFHIIYADDTLDALDTAASLIEKDEERAAHGGQLR